jgi:hypothetical protein
LPCAHLCHLSFYLIILSVGRVEDDLGFSGPLLRQGR